MKRVILESPYAGDVEGNMRYLDKCMLDCLMRGEAPFASHRMYTSCLDDNVPGDRALGIEAGLEWARFCSTTVVYMDRGLSSGMRQGIRHALKHGRDLHFRLLYSRKQPTQVECTRWVTEALERDS